MLSSTTPMGDDRPEPPRTSMLALSAGFGRATAALASPIGLLVSVPALVLLTGGAVSLFGQLSLHKTSWELTRERFETQTAGIAHELTSNVSATGPLLSRLVEVAQHHDPDRPLGPIAHELASTLRARPGLAYASVSFADGTFQGAYVDTDGRLRFQDSRVSPEGTRVRRFDLDGRDGVVPYKNETTAYDPRTRSFYQRATERGGRVFTAPYPFYKSFTTGVTVAEPVYAPDRSVRAVVTVDLDVRALTQALVDAPLPPGARAILYADDGTVLAYPRGTEAMARVAASEQRVVHHRDLGDPVVDALMRSPLSNARQGTELMRSPDGRHLVTVRRLSLDGVAWTFAMLIPESTFVGELRAFEGRSLAFGGSALIAGLWLAALLAWNAARVRREVRRVRAEFHAAASRARDLGSYRLVEQLGRGGMGEVWRGRHRLLARDAAIKIIRPETLTRDGVDPIAVRQRFHREAEAMARLSSRNTVRLYDYGFAEDGTFYVVMELLDGLDLEALVRRYGAQRPGRVIRILMQMCRSLAEAHDRGLVHRDIKPANVILCREGDDVDVVKVLDFGLARVADAQSVAPEDGKLMGTPGYMAPEQAMPADVDARADLYAVGAVAWLLLSGNPVFDVDVGIVLLHLHATMALPELLGPNGAPLPARLVEIVKGCLAKKPSDRPVSARALLAALSSVELDTADAWTEADAVDWWDDVAPSALVGADTTRPPRVLTREVSGLPTIERSLGD